MKRTMLVALAAATAANLAMAQEPTTIAPEILTVEETIHPGRNIFLTDPNGTSASNINVMGADDLKLKGNVSPGQSAQAAITRDGARIYSASHYFKRIISGPDDPVLAEWDTQSLTLLREIPISDRLVMATNQPTMVTLTADEKFVLIQYATPATSVGVVSLEEGKHIAEIPTPGCWTIMPAAEGLSFSTVCGDGTLASYTFEADGSFGAPIKTPTFFDPEKDPVFTSPATAAGKMIFASYNGTLFTIDQSDGIPTLVDSFSITEGIEGNWAPGGGEVVAYNAPSDVAFVLMHPNAKDGTHKDVAKEIWAVDMATKDVLYRSPAHGENTIVSTQDEVPTIYAGGKNSLRRYSADPEAKYALKVAAETKGFGAPGIIMVTE